MPKGLVKTKRDEKLWNEAKQQCRDQGLSAGDGDRFWKCVNGTYQEMKGSGRGGGATASTAHALRRWHANYDG